MSACIPDGILHCRPAYDSCKQLFSTPSGCVLLLLGGDFEPALLQQPFGISRTDAVSFILKGFQAALTGNRLLAA